MASWIFSVIVDEKAKYYYELDRALKEMPSHTIYQSQSRIRSIEVGDIVYLYECAPEKAIGWKCRVLAVNVPYCKTSDIDESEFEHGETERDGYYMKVTALGRYKKEDRKALSLEKLKENGLNPNLKSIRPAVRPNAQLLKYIDSVPLVKPND